MCEQQGGYSGRSYSSLCIGQESEEVLSGQKKAVNDNLTHLHHLLRSLRDESHRFALNVETAIGSQSS
jgi:excinuclease UvrABC nuclease subunit